MWILGCITAASTPYRFSQWHRWDQEETCLNCLDPTVRRKWWTNTNETLWKPCSGLESRKRGFTKVTLKTERRSVKGKWPRLSGEQNLWRTRQFIWRTLGESFWSHAADYEYHKNFAWMWVLLQEEKIQEYGRVILYVVHYMANKWQYMMCLWLFSSKNQGMDK